MANFEKDFNKKMEKLGYSITYYDDIGFDPLEDESPETTNIYIGFHALNGTIKELQDGKDIEVEGIHKTFRVPKKKLITPDYIISKVNKENVFMDFSKGFKKLLINAGYSGSGMSIYPTSYGIGVFVIFSSGLEQIKENIENTLSRYGIEYSNEYSDARWVFRYRISKKKENIDKLNCLIN